MTTATLTELDPVFVEVADAVYGGALDPREVWDLAKLDAADVHVAGSLKKVNQKPRRITKADDPKQHSNTARALVLGGVAEGLGTFRAGQEASKVVRSPALKAATTLPGKLKAVSAGGKVAEAGLQGANLGIGLLAAHKLAQNSKQPVAKGVKAAMGERFVRATAKLRPVKAVMSDEQAAKHTAAVGRRNTAGTRAVAGASLGLGLVAGHHLAMRNTNTDPEQVGKALTPVASAAPVTGALKPLAAGVRPANSGGAGRGLGRRGRPLGPSAAPAMAPMKTLSKATTWRGEITKVDDDKRQVFGWCSLSEVNGEPVIDRQGDYIPLDEVEKSAYVYVLESRKGGDMHARVRKGLSTEWDQPKHTADLIESVVFTPEKLEAMGLVSKNGTLGWWVGFKVNDEQQWDLVKTGERTAFSIHGTGSRSDVA